MKICVFCSANGNLDPDIYAVAENLGRWIGRNGHTLVFGGTDMGLMESVARPAREAGAMVVGVVPTKIERHGHTSCHLDVHIPCDNLSDRKELMMARSDAFVALPGGIGTLDEVFTVAAAATLGYHRKPVALLNVNGYWDTLIAMLDDLSRRNGVRGNWRDTVVVATSLEQLEELLSR